MNEYLGLGHMHVVKTKDENNGKYYIPHQPVLREDSTTTNLRVVFDASNGISLNETMLVGPKLQLDIIDILLRWRTNKIAFTADIEKMYRQIKLNEDDQEYHRFSNQERIKEYKLTTIIYGTASAPYIAVYI